MSVVRYISDLHLSHLNMAKRRGFETFEEHDEHIINSWNSVVEKRDVTWILGDITMEKTSPYVLLNRLNGIKKVILGNHDKPQHVQELLKYVNSVCSVKYLQHKEYGNVIFSHIPVHPNELKYEFSKNIHGHTHLNKVEHIDMSEIDAYGKIDKRYVNVCAEMIGYKPKLLEELLNGQK